MNTIGVTVPLNHFGQMPSVLIIPGAWHVGFFVSGHGSKVKVSIGCASTVG